MFECRVYYLCAVKKTVCKSRVVIEVISLIIGAVYICTEDVFPSKRLQQLIDQQHKLRADVPAEIIQKIKFGNGIFVEHAADLVSSSTNEECIIIAPKSNNYRGFFIYRRPFKSELRSVMNTS